MAGTLLKLNTGRTIPAIGFGTWQDKDDQKEAVKNALLAGYRHIDGAAVYETEPAVAAGIKASRVRRDQIFITTKLWCNNHHPEDVEKACDESLKKLETDYIDLYLVHWPNAFERGEEKFPKHADGKPKVANIDFLDTWKAMEKLQRSGKAKDIGISNFSNAELDRLLKGCEIKPAVHQIELHPYLQQKAFLKKHHDLGIHVTAYSPFGNSNPIYTSGQSIPQLIQDPELAKIGAKYGKTGAQTALAWGISNGVSVIPKSKTPERIRANYEGDFKLSAEDLAEIAKLDKKMRFNDSSEDFGYDFFTDLDGKA